MLIRWVWLLVIVSAGCTYSSASTDSSYVEVCEIYGPTTKCWLIDSDEYVTIREEYGDNIEE